MESKDPWSGREYRSVSRHSRDAARTARSAQKRQSPVARGSDKVQLMSAVGPMQANGHNKTHGTGGIVPAVATKARAGHPRFRNGKQYPESRATRLKHSTTVALAARPSPGRIEKSMSPKTLQEVERAIGDLTPQEVQELYVWLEQHFPQAMDARLPSDLSAGRLDTAIQRALDDEKNGRVRPL
jgi:hypothetical protein